MEKKHIVFVYRNLVLGGAERVLISVLGLLKENPNYEVTLLLTRDQELGHFTIPEGVKVHRILSRMEAEFEVQSILNLCKAPDYWRDYARRTTNNRLCDFINQNKVDLIINFEDHFDQFLADFNVHSSIPVIRWVHVKWYFDVWKNDPNYHSVILGKQNPIVVICDDMLPMAEETVKQLKLENKTIKRIYNPLEIQRIHDKMQQVRPEDEALLNDNYILQVARLHPIKNHLEMLDIYAQLKQKGIPHKLYILGDGEQREALAQRIQELGLEQDCLLLGANSNPYPFMKNAKLFIHTSHSEGLPTVFLESMACGTPVVSYDCPTGPREILCPASQPNMVN